MPSQTDADRLVFSKTLRSISRTFTEIKKNQGNASSRCNILLRNKFNGADSQGGIIVVEIILRQF